MSDRSLAQWLQYLEHLHPSEMELGLERVSLVAGRLSLLAPTCPVVTVAGTNGKGSTVAALEALLLFSGRKVGTFTSPHLQRYNERIRVAGEEVADEEIVAAFELIENARADTSLTYFEFSTLAALQVFRGRAVDVILLEVGLGGRLDATNILDPTLAVVTSIALDHQDWLGTTRGEIALEKAGILRPGKPAIIADADPPPELLDQAAALGATPVWCYGRDFSELQDAGVGYLEIMTGPGESLRIPSPQRSDLLPQNLCAALQAASMLKALPAPEQCLAVLSRLVVTGRREILQVGQLSYVIDVAHNPASAAMLGEFLVSEPCQGRTLAIFSAMADKDIAGILAPLTTCVDAWFVADQPDNPRAAAASDIASTLRSIGATMISVSKNLRQALRRAQQLMSIDDRLVVFGSFYTVAAVQPLLDRDRKKVFAGAAT
jgi:dihydrofolate synthase/folylpolyglutamate synthase